MSDHDDSHDFVTNEKLYDLLSVVLSRANPWCRYMRASHFGGLSPTLAAAA